MGKGLLKLYLWRILDFFMFFSRPQMKSSVNCLLMGLASFDTVLIVTSILMFGLPAVYTYTDHPVFQFYFYEVYIVIMELLIHKQNVTSSPSRFSFVHF